MITSKSSHWSKKNDPEWRKNTSKYYSFIHNIESSTKVNKTGMVHESQHEKINCDSLAFMSSIHPSIPWRKTLKETAISNIVER